MKRWIVLVLASLMLLSLCSCAEPAEESNAGVSSETQDESTPENEPAQQSSADSETGVMSHSTISETWDSGVVVDADVTAIKEETLSTYTGELRVFTVDELAEAFGLSVDSATSSITDDCNGVQREHNKKLNNGLPILHKVPPKRDYGRYFCILAEKGGTSHGGLTEKLSPFFTPKNRR